MTTTNHSFVQSIFMCKFCFKKYSYIINFGIKIELNDGLNGMVKKQDRIGWKSVKDLWPVVWKELKVVPTLKM